jgi:hypothetical protein
MGIIEAEAAGCRVRMYDAVTATARRVTADTCGDFTDGRA